MRASIFLAVSFSLILLLSMGCRDASKNKSDAPYPPLEEQRKQLSEKLPVTPVRSLDSVQLIADLRFLSSDSCQGRGPGSPGHSLALNRIVQRYREAGLDSVNNSYIQEFPATDLNGEKRGFNVIGMVKGTIEPNKVAVISAHYDHLGIVDGDTTYFGADDNASGTACLLALAKYCRQHPIGYTILFVAFDREETGLEGSQYFVEHLKDSPDSMKWLIDINMDMIARSDANEIFACGVARNPTLRYLVDEVQTKTNTILLMGHDTGPSRDDWTNQSDQGPFSQRGIPFIYIGVEDHPDYHRPTDTFDKINLNHYLENCNMILQMIRALK